jgi:hypothetical protein
MPGLVDRRAARLGTRCSRRHDVEHQGVAVRAEMDQLTAELRTEMTQLSTELRTEMTQLRQEMDLRFDHVETRIDAAKAELLAAFRGELVTTVSGQTRAMIFTMAGTVAALGGLALSLARLA